MSERAERLEAYRFHERDWGSYAELYDAFEWEIPAEFNMARYLCDRWADAEKEEEGSAAGADREGQVALFYETEAGRQETYTFGELRESANGLADFLAARGISRGDRVGVNVPQKPATAITHLAAWKLGAVSVPLSTLFGPDALSYRLEDSGALACVVDRSNAGTLRGVRGDLDDLDTVVTVDAAPKEGETGFAEAIDVGSESERRDTETVATDPEEDAIIIYTSGTTGDPKGVRHAHRVLLGHLPLFLTTFCNMAIEDGDVYWTPAEWAWIASLFDVVLPSLFYGKPVLAYSGGAFDPQDAFSLIERYELTNVFAPPTALRMLMQADPAPYDLDSVRVLPSGGESLGDSIVVWAEQVFDGAAVQEGYGQTEANVLVGDCTSLTDFREGTIGVPGPGHEIAIVDPETTEPLASGEVGEIAVRYGDDPVCFKEYWKNPAATSEKVRNGWLCTEDLGAIDEEGYVTFHGRADDVIISAGYRIGPEEIEDCLAGHDAIADAAVVGVPDAERGEVPKAFCVLATGQEPSEELRDDLREHVRERLAAYEYPRAIEFLEELPTTVTGKVRRASLRDRAG